MEAIAMPQDELEQARAAARRFGAETSLDLMQQEYWYRLDAFDIGGTVRLTMCRIKVLRYTPKGVYVSGDGFGFYEKWVPREARKRWCYPTRKLAVDSFIKRKQRQLIICRRILEVADQGLALAKAKYAGLVAEDSELRREQWVSPNIEEIEF